MHLRSLVWCSQAFLAVNEFPDFPFSEVDLCKHHVCEMQSVLWRVGSSPARQGLPALFLEPAQFYLSIQCRLPGAFPSLFQLSGAVIHTCNGALAPRFALRWFWAVQKQPWLRGQQVGTVVGQRSPGSGAGALVSCSGTSSTARGAVPPPGVWDRSVTSPSA